MRQVIVRQATNEIVDIRAFAEVVENGIFVGDCILGEQGLIIREAATVPANVKKFSHCYDGTSFTTNPDYVPPVQTALEQRIADLELMMADLIFG